MIGSVENGAEVISPFRLHIFVWHVGLSILLEVKLASLQWDAAKGRQPSCSQASMMVRYCRTMIVAGDELHTSQPAFFEAL